MRRTTLLALIASIALPLPAHAQRGGRRSGPAASAPATRGTLETEAPTEPMPDADTLTSLIQTAALSGNAAGAHTIAVLLLRGVPPRVAAAGLDALGVLGRPEGASVVSRFLHHRRASLRRHAVAAAQAIGTPDLVRALAGALGDSDVDVRAEAAAALGEAGNREVVPALFAAFEHDLERTSGPEGARLVHESAKAIARVGSAQDVTRLLAFLRRAPFTTMADAMRAALGRRELPEALRLQIVSAVGDLATREAREFLTAVVADAGGRETAVTRAARTAAERIAE